VLDVLGLMTRFSG
jgi:hypothetical protein